MDRLWSGRKRKREEDEVTSNVGNLTEAPPSALTTSSPKLAQQPPASTTTQDSHDTAAQLSKSGLVKLSEPVNPETTVADVVFVHGLNGSSYSTWLHKDSGIHWPSIFLCQDINNVRIFTFGYDATVFKLVQQVSRHRIKDHAEKLLNYLTIERESTATESRKIIFVAHSLGGLVVQNALALSSNNSEQHFQKADFVTRFTDVFKDTNREVVKVLQEDSPILATISYDFGQFVNKRQNAQSAVAITCFHEEYPMKTPAGAANMTKFATASDPGYKATVGTLRRSIKSNQAQSSGAVTMTEEQLACLRSLDFQQSTAREDEISPAVSDTFRWIWTKSELRFLHWLQHGGGTYWITGKPGSGKSTLMKYLSVDPLVVQYLRTTSPFEPITAAFFFDFKASKESLANSQLGLLQSLLWQLLKRKPSDIDMIYPKYKEKERHRSEVRWSRQDLEPVLLAVLKGPESPNVCLFIDALDEFDGKDTELGTFLNGLAQSAARNLRLCIASRPSFLHPFKTYQRIHIEEHTRADIETFTHAQLKPLFEDDNRSEYLSARSEHNEAYTHTRLIDRDNKCNPRSALVEPDSYRQLAHDVAEKSQGVFLWVRLVTEELLQGWSLGNNLAHLRAQLHCLPEDMLKLYQRILNNMEACQREDVNHVAFLVAHAADPFRLPELQYVMNSLESARHKSNQDLRNIIRICGLFEIQLNRVHPSHETASAFYRKMSTSTNWHEYLLRTSILCLCEISDYLLPLTWDYIDETLRLLQLGSDENLGSIDNVTCRTSTMVELFEILKKHTFLEYSIRHWLYHARLAEITSRNSQHDLLKVLGIRNRLQFWRVLAEAVQCRHEYRGEYAAASHRGFVEMFMKSVRGRFDFNLVADKDDLSFMHRGVDIACMDDSYVRIPYGSEGGTLQDQGFGIELSMTRIYMDNDLDLSLYQMMGLKTQHGQLEFPSGGITEILRNLRALKQPGETLSEKHILEEAMSYPKEELIKVFLNNDDDLSMEQDKLLHKCIWNFEDFLLSTGGDSLSRLVLGYIAKSPHIAAWSCSVYDHLIRYKISGVTGPLIKHFERHAVEAEGIYSVGFRSHVLKAENILAGYSFSRDTSLEFGLIDGCDGEIWELPSNIGELDVNKRFDLLPYGEVLSGKFTEVRNCEVFSTESRCGCQPLEHALRQLNLFHSASPEKVGYWAHSKDMSMAHLCAGYPKFMRNIARFLIDRGAQCNATIRKLAATDVEIRDMVSKLSDNEEEISNGLGTDYKRCYVFDFERSERGFDSGEESYASEDRDEEADWETKNREVDQGSGNGDNDCLPNNETTD